MWNLCLGVCVCILCVCCVCVCAWWERVATGSPCVLFCRVSMHVYVGSRVLCVEGENQPCVLCAVWCICEWCVSCVFAVCACVHGGREWLLGLHVCCSAVCPCMCMLAAVCCVWKERTSPVCCVLCGVYVNGVCSVCPREAKPVCA
ncbi:unnamed protein product [Camellia sinensis]